MNVRTFVDGKWSEDYTTMEQDTGLTADQLDRLYDENNLTSFGAYLNTAMIAE